MLPGAAYWGLQKQVRCLVQPTGACGNRCAACCSPVGLAETGVLPGALQWGLQKQVCCCGPCLLGLAETIVLLWPLPTGACRNRCAAWCCLLGLAETGVLPSAAHWGLAETVLVPHTGACRSRCSTLCCPLGLAETGVLPTGTCRNRWAVWCCPLGLAETGVLPGAAHWGLQKQLCCSGPCSLGFAERCAVLPTGACRNRCVAWCCPLGLAETAVLPGAAHWGLQKQLCCLMPPTGSCRNRCAVLCCPLGLAETGVLPGAAYWGLQKQVCCPDPCPVGLAETGVLLWPLPTGTCRNRCAALAPAHWGLQKQVYCLVPLWQSCLALRQGLDVRCLEQGLSLALSQVR